MPPKRKAAQDADTKRKKAKTGDDFPIPKFNLSWRMHGATNNDGVGTLLILDGDQPGCSKIAGFDIDFTIIKTKSGRKFATGAKDWTWYFTCIPEKLQALHKEGYRIVFFTNQAGIEKGKVAPKEVMTKVNDIVEKLDIPVFTFACTGQNEYRKPSTFVWDYFVKNCNKNVEVDLSKCVYIGDAAGRPKDWLPGKTKDFSCSDRMFAANIGIDFMTPEEYFHKDKPATFSWGSVDPVKFLNEHKDTGKDKQEYHKKDKELVVMVGPPASGKSTFSKRYLMPHGYVSVNRDTLGTQEKCYKAATKGLEDGNSVVIDNTNPSKAVRQNYIEIANEEGASCRCFCMQTDFNIAHHLNLVRQNQTNGKSRRVPDVGYNMYKKHYDQPELSEGFTEIKKIDLVPKFDSKRDEALFKQWTTAGH